LLDPAFFLKSSKYETGTAMDIKQEIKQDLSDLFSDQNLAVLATHHSGQPYASLVAFAATPDLKHLLFVTGTATRKFSNLQSDPRAAMIIDNRENQAMDIARAMAATATGTTEIVPEEHAGDLKKLYLARHPHLEEFLESPSTSLMQLRVKCYYVVRKFQHVTELHMDS
jgi:nitroimidazol reductase NimA-like FMN-containing flavoprotein (pyridoxamine 5'-phosphate oxidase superfamily)